MFKPFCFAFFIMRGSPYIPYLTTFLPICSANPFLQLAQTNVTVGAAACEAIGKSLAIENVTVNFAQVRPL
jgi:hypothetical protein